MTNALLDFAQKHELPLLELDVDSKDPKLVELLYKVAWYEMWNTLGCEAQLV